MKRELMEVPREGEKKKEKRKRRDESTDFSAARLKLKLAAVGRGQVRGIREVQHASSRHVMAWQEGNSQTKVRTIITGER